ncbi:MAG: presenilin family intramembrane aspartyl protease PSH [Candidatus Aenigmatarchaeota archaeon]
MIDIDIKQKHLPAIAIICVLVLVHMAALNVVHTYPDEYRAFGEEGAEDPLNPLIYVGFILLFTGAMLLLFKYGKGNFLQYLILGVVGLTLFYVFYPVLFTSGVRLGTIPPDWAFFAAISLGVGLTYLLYKKPEWYIVNGIGMIMAVGIIGIFGMTFAILPVFILLIALAVYDFISVYKTKHMLSLASGVMESKTPVMMVVPQKKNYSYAKKKNVMKGVKKSDKREAMFIGLGDIIIPGILPVSASIYLEPLWIGGYYGPVLVAVGSTLGAMCGMIALTRFVLKGKPHAGLPLLNSGAILGYMLTYFLLYQDMTFGIVIPW